MSIMKQLMILLSLCSLLSCHNKKELKETNTSEDAISESLFTVVPFTESGIGFVNEIPENSAMNSMDLRILLQWGRGCYW